MEMKFEKYTGIGNDFIICSFELTKEQIRKLCDRRFGIGADGLIRLMKSENNYFMDFYNSDGSKASMCGNGIRCYAHYLYNNKLIDSEIVEIDTLSGIKKIQYIKDNEDFKVKVDMGHPFNDSFKNRIKVLDKEFDYAYTYTGTDHIVIFVKKEDLNTDFVLKYGPIIQKEKDSNVNFVSVIDRDNIEVITYERGAGLTLACGTGAVASGYISHSYNLTNSTINANLLGGSLKIDVTNDTIYMIGKSEYLFKGSVKI